MTEATGVIVVGAGVAGLAAAAALREAGIACEVLEASPRIGGRAYTTTPAELAGAAFDHGASWLHAAGRNPLVPIAEAAGETLWHSDDDWSRRLAVGGVPATAADEAAYDDAERRFAALTAQAARAARDCSVAQAVSAMADDPWLATVENFEAALIAAADSRDLSVRDCARNALDGVNLNVRGGLGAFVARRLAQAVRLATPVRRIAWGGSGGRVAATTRDGTLQAAACIVTVSTGVLRAGGIVFDPPLPDSHLTALAGLPMGLLTKIGFAASSLERLGIASQTQVLNRQQARHAATVSFIARPAGAEHVVGFLGGAAAWDMARAGAAATADLAREQWRSALGGAVGATLGPALVTGWARDPWSLGAYAYARTGHAKAREALARPIGGGRLLFAGEAVATDGLAGTVGGAWNSGRAAAASVAALLRAA